jgi:hypothetical protein
MTHTIHTRITIDDPRMTSGKSSFMECKVCPAVDHDQARNTFFCHDKGETIWE